MTPVFFLTCLDHPVNSERIPNRNDSDFTFFPPVKIVFRIFLTAPTNATPSRGNKYYAFRLRGQYYGMERAR